MAFHVSGSGAGDEPKFEPVARVGPGVLRGFLEECGLKK